MHFIHLDSWKIAKGIIRILPYFGSALYLYQRMPMGLNILPAIWQSYVNALLDCLQSRKYCVAIMDDLLLFTPTKTAHFVQVRRLAEGTMQKWTENISKEVPTFYDIITLYGEYHIHKR